MSIKHPESIQHKKVQKLPEVVQNEIKTKMSIKHPESIRHKKVQKLPEVVQKAKMSIKQSEPIQHKKIQELPEKVQKAKMSIKQSEPIQHKQHESSEPKKLLVSDINSSSAQNESNTISKEPKVLFKEQSMSINYNH